MEEKKSEQNKPDWAIGELYRQAWEIIKKHKVLWVFGMAAGAGVGINNVINSLNQSDLTNFFEKFNQQQQTTPAEISRVLGKSTSALSDIFFYLFSATPLSFYIILAIEFLLLIAIGISISLVYNAWATGSLLAGIQTAITGEKPTIKDSSKKAIPHIKSLVWLAIVPIVTLALVTMGIFIFFSLGLAFAGSAKPIFLFLLFIAVVVFLIAVFMLTLAQIWAQRYVVLDNKKGKEALFSGLKMVRKKFWSMLLLGITNNILIVLAVGAPIGIIAGVLVSGLFAFNIFNTDYNTRILLIAPFIMTVAIFSIFLFPIVGGIINAFKATVWSLAYNSIRGKYDK